MEIAIIYNKYLKVSSYLKTIQQYKTGLEKSGLKVFSVPSSDILMDGKNPGFNCCLFFDKDIVLAEYMENIGVRVINSSESIRICDDKSLTYVHLLNKQINMPKTIISPFIFKGENPRFNIMFEFPYIIKETKGSWGEQVYLIKNNLDLNKVIDKVKDKRFVVQQYLPDGNTDIRVFVIGEKAVCAMKRTNNSDFRSNAQVGGECEKYELIPEVSQLAERASQALNLDYCGVDIIINEGEPYLIEVNSNPFINMITSVTNTDVAKLLGEYIKTL